MSTPADLWAVLPVKPFAEAKSRLSAVLSVDERHVLARNLVERTLSVLGAVVPSERCLIVSRDPTVLALATAHGAETLVERGDGLNLALRQAVPVVSARGAGSLLVVAADLPLLAAADLEALIVAGEAVGVAVAPDRRGSGTNALYLRPPTAVDFAFGPDSCRRHVALATSAGRPPRLVETTALAFDLDLPADLDLLDATSRAELLAPAPDLSLA